MVKRIFRYLSGTTNIGLMYGNGKECLVTRYNDSDYTADVDTMKVCDWVCVHFGWFCG